MKFRFARHTNNLDKLKQFYTRVLDFEVLGSFEIIITMMEYFLENKTQIGI